MLAEIASGYRKALAPSEFLGLLGVGQESYCRYLWFKGDDEKQNRWSAIGKRASGKPVTNIVDFKLRSEKFVQARGCKLPSVDVFLSPNQFFDWRNSEQLSSLHASWIEVDTKDHARLSVVEQQQILAEVLSQINRMALPPPTGWVFSGSGGVHIYWVYSKPEAAYKWRVGLWREVAEKLSALKGGERWVVDFSASHDPSRVLRMPGTVHSGTGRIVDAYVGGPTIEFDALARLLGVDVEKAKPKLRLVSEGKGTFSRTVQNETVEKKNAKPIYRNTEATNDSRPNKGRHTIGQWWFKIYTNVVSQLRDQGVKEGRRDLVAFILYVAMRHIKKTEPEAYEEIERVNDELIGLEPGLLQRYLATARREKYKYRKKSVGAYLEKIGVNSEFLHEDRPAPLPLHEVKVRQQKSAQITAKKKADKTLEKLSALIQNAPTATQEALSKVAGCSVRTVRRYWSLLRKVQVISSPSIYSAPHNLLGFCPV